MNGRARIISAFNYIRTVVVVILISLLLLQNDLYSQPADTLLRWPAPPDQARIKHLQTISSVKDFKQDKGFFSNLLRFIMGGESSSTWLVQPVGIAVAPDGRIAIADPGANGIHILNLEKKEYDFIAETEFGKFISPVGVTFASDGALYVSDSQRGDIIVFDDDMDADFQIKEQMSRPTGISIAGDVLYVVDTGEHKIVLFNRKGKYVSSFGKRGNGPGEFNYPVHIAADESLYVLDGLNYRVQTFGSNGTFGSTFGRQGNIAGRFASPKAIARDSDGDIYVTDALMDNVQIFNKTGQLLLIIGGKGSSDGQFMSPSGICIDTNDKIYVVETLNKRIQIFQYLK